MPLTKAFRDSVHARAQSDQAFVKALLTKAMSAYLSGDEATGKAILRDVVHSTIGFPHLGEVLGKSEYGELLRHSPSTAASAGSEVGGRSGLIDAP